MKAGFFSRLFALAAMCVSSAVPAAEQPIPSNAGAESKASSAGKISDQPSVTATGLFSKPVVFRGTLGDTPIQFAVRPKAIVDEGLEGEYFIFGRSQKILLAGELEDGTLFLEESENGTSISGQWEGKLQGDVLQGTWKSADESVSRPFKLKLIPGRTNAKQPGPVRKVSATANAVSAASR